MKNVNALVLFLLLATSIVDLFAADWKAVKGTYAVTPKNYIDPSDEEQKDSHFRLQLSGDAARDLNQAMKVSEASDACTGATAKNVGEIQCLYYKNEKKYTCNFSIDVMQQKIEYGVAC